MRDQDERELLAESTLGGRRSLVGRAAQLGSFAHARIRQKELCSRRILVLPEVAVPSEIRCAGDEGDGESISRFRHIR